MIKLSSRKLKYCSSTSLYIEFDAYSYCTRDESLEFFPPRRGTLSYRIESIAFRDFIGIFVDICDYLTYEQSVP